MLTIGLVVVICLLLVMFFYRYCVKPQSYWKNKGVLHAKSAWLFGENWNLILGRECLWESMRRIYKQFPNSRYFGIYQFNQPILVVKDPELIKMITIKDFEHFVDHRMWVPEAADPLWSNNVFSLQGEKWKEMRTFLSPAFTGRKMKNMFILMKDAANRLTQYLENEHKDLMEVDLKDILNRCTCDILATTAFGIEVNSLKNRNNEFYTLAEEAGTFTGFNMLTFFATFIFPEFIVKALDIRVYSKKIGDFFSNLIYDTIRTREEKKIVRPDMIHLMMEARKGRHEYDDIEEEEDIDGKFESSNTNTTSSPKTKKTYITDTEIVSQAMVFIVGGFETLSSLLRFMAYELAANSDIQERLRLEINETFEACNRSLTYEDIQKMKYMGMVVAECLRKWPNAPMLDRVCTKPYTIPPCNPQEKEIKLQVGDLLWIPVIGLHYDPQLYPNPEKFDPERYSDENKNEINPYTYVPFGVGPRVCLGNRFALLEAKVLFFNLLKSFEIVPVEKSSIPIKLLKNTFALDGDSFTFGLKKLK